MKSVKRLLLLLILMVICYTFYYCWVSFPIATGYGAKVLCSAVFLSERDEKNVIAEDLDFFPVRHVQFTVNRKDSSVTASLWGLAFKKAVFRGGLGSTLVNDISEEELRLQRFVLPHLPGVAADSLPWPMGDRIAGTFPAALDSMRLVKAVDKVFSGDDDERVNRTRALVIVYEGRIIAERYGPGIHRHTRLAGWSMTKSITGALVGILAERTPLLIDEPAPVREWNNASDERHSITLRHLLRQSSGLDFEEVYDKSSHANRMLFQRGNAAAYAADRNVVAAPGTVFHYSSGNSNILSRICREVLGDTLYHRFPYEELFYKTGMFSAVLEPDASGTYVGSSFCYATARDWARFGLLYLQQGRMNGVQLIPTDWIRQSLQPAPSAPRGEYGFQWWLNRGAREEPGKRIYPNLPADMYFADGYEGQNLFIIPSKKLVIVRLGLTRRGHWGESDFISEVIRCLRP